MAPKRQGSFLTRGRQRVQQTQQMKQASARQLPPKGGTGANKPKATAQRTATAVTQRVRQDVATLRALGENMKRNQARAERQIPADKSPSVRRVGPGGANPKPQGQLPGTNPNQLRLPGTSGGADQVRGSGVRTGQPGPTRAALPPARPKPPAPKGATTARTGGRPALPPGQTGGALAVRGSGRINIGGLRGGLIGAVGGMAADAIGRKTGEAIGGFLRDQSNKPKEDKRSNRPGGGSNKPPKTGDRPGLRYEKMYDTQGGRSNYGLDKPKPVAPLPTSVRQSSTSGGSSGSSTRASSPTGRSTPKPSPTTGSSKPQSDSAPKPPNTEKVETTTTDAPKPPTIGSKAMKEMKARRGVGRDEMIAENLRRARRKSS